MLKTHRTTTGKPGRRKSNFGVGDRVEGKLLQAVSVNTDSYESLAERLERARNHVLEGMTEEELNQTKAAGL